ncbi:MAG: hypothetical protein ABW143_09020 [Acidimicrobiales bacterium]
MAGKVRVKLNRPGMTELLRTPDMHEMLGSKGERVATAARGSAPVESGEYQAGITTVSGTDTAPSLFTTPPRAAVGVGSTAPHALIVEGATGNLLRALDAAR